MTSEDLKSCYIALLKLQKACGCESVDNKRIGCKKDECELFENGRCPVIPLKLVILNVECRRAREKLLEEFEHKNTDET